MNNFDWIVPVAVGSLAASQYTLTWLAVRSGAITKFIKDEPTLLAHKGDYLKDAMLKTRVTEAEVDAALRENGLMRLEDANRVFLETEGTLSMVPKQDIDWGDAPMISNVQAPEKIGQVNS